MLTSLVFLAIQTPTLTFESPGITVKALVQEIAKQSGQNLESGQMDDRLVIVRYDHVKPQEAMDALAQAEVGVWIHSGDKQTFRPSPQKADEILQTFVHDRAQIYERDLAEIRQLAGPDGYSTDFIKNRAQDISVPMQQRNGVDDFVKMQTLGYGLPGGRMLSRCLTSIGAEQLAGLTPGGYYTFASNPTSLQIPINDASDTLQSFQTEQSSWLKGSTPIFGKFQRHFSLDTTASAANATGFLISFFGGHQNNLGVSDIKIYDSSGTILTSFVSPIMLNHPKANKVEDEYFKHIDESKIYADIPEITEQIIRGKGPWTPDSKFREVILHPDKFNIPALGPGTAILISGRSLGLNLTIPLHDNAMLAWPQYWHGHQIRPEVVIQYIQDPRIPERPKGDGWIVTRPEPYELSKLSAPVASMVDFAHFAQNVEKDHDIPIDPYATLLAFSGVNHGDHETLVPRTHGWILDLQLKALTQAISDIKGTGWVDHNYDPITLYGLIPETLRTLSRTEAIPFTSLPEECRKAVILAVRNSHLNRTNLPKGGAGTIWDEPTVFFASNEVKSGTLRIKDEEYETYQWRSPETSYWREAAPKIDGDNQSLSKERSAPADHYRPVHGRRITLTFQWPTALFKLRLTCDDPTGSTVLRFEDLPDSARGASQ